MSAPYAGPSPDHLLGTDALGRDVLLELVRTALPTFAVPALAALVLATLGTVLGVVLGLAPRVVRDPVLRAGDVLTNLPPLVAVLLIVVGFGATPGSLVAAVTVSTIVLVVRVIAAATRQLASAAHLEAAIGLGAPRWRAALQHAMPRLLPIVTAETMLRFLGAIHLVAALGFLGLATGIGDTWAGAIRRNLLGFGMNPWATAAPSLALVIAVAVAAVLVERRPAPAGGPR